MSDYYDSKGIRHLKQWDAERANEGYLQEERDARERNAEAAREAADQAASDAALQREAMERSAEAAELAARESSQQTEALERMAEEAEMQRMEDERHNLEMRRLKERELKNQEQQNKFQRDLLFLEKENPSDRKYYVIKRVLEEKNRGVFIMSVPVRLIRATVLNHMNLLLPRFEDLLADFKAPSIQYADCQAKQRLLENRRSKLKSDLERFYAARSRIILPVVILFFTLISSYVLLMLLLLLPVLGKMILLILLGLSLFIPIMRIGRSVKEIAVIKQRWDGILEILMKECDASLQQVENQIKDIVAKQDYIKDSILVGVTNDSRTAITSDVLSNYCSPQWYLKSFIPLVESFQNDFPKSLRIRPNDLTEQDLEENYIEFAKQILPGAVSQEMKLVELQITPDTAKCVIEG